MKSIKIMKDVISGQCANSLIRIQIGYTAIFVGVGYLPKKLLGLQFGIFAPAHNPEIGYRRIAFYGSILPGLNKSMSKWPKWYRWLFNQMKFRRKICFSKKWK